MQDEWPSRRVTMLEQRVEQLETLPGEVAALRTEMRAEFADVRAEMRAEFADVRAEMRAEFADVRAEMRAEFTNVRAEMNAGFADVRADMDAKFAAVHDVLIACQTQITDNHRHMLVLHEEVLSRIATLGERWPQPPGTRKKPQRG
jgi:hypothetical protein